MRPLWAALIFRAVRCPPGLRPDLARVTNLVYNVGFEMSVEKFPKISRQEKFLNSFRNSRPPDFAMRTTGKVYATLTLRRDCSQAVLKYRFQVRTASFPTQGDNGVDAHGAACRNRCGDATN